MNNPEFSLYERVRLKRTGELGRVSAVTPSRVYVRFDAGIRWFGFANVTGFPIHPDELESMAGAEWMLAGWSRKNRIGSDENRGDQIYGRYAKALARLGGKENNPTDGRFCA